MCCLIYKFLLILTQKMQISFLKILPENALKFVSKKMRICVKNFAQLQFLAECAVKDKVWGIGLSMTDPKRLEPSLWRGQNLLGFALMMVRKKLK